MTQLEVMKAFMARLANHGYSVSNATATNMLNSAVVASSRFTSINEVIQSMKDNQADCEANAIYNVVTKVLGANWYLEKCVNYLTDENGDFVLDKDNQKQIASFKTLSEIETLLNSATKENGSSVTYDDVKDFTAAKSYTSLSNVIKEVTANDFLKNCCGIQLNKNYYISGSTIFSAGNSGNTDTGAITGSDANIVYHKDDFDDETWEQAKTLFPQYYGAVLSEDETTLTIGKGTTKTAEDIVPETWLNTYIATTNQAQKITTGTRDWVVKATAANDTIISGGADSINAGAGNDEINIAGNGATVTAGDGADTIEISADVKKVTITDLNADDTLTIAGSFEVGAAKIEDMMLVITDKTGTRKITLGDLETAKGGKINLDGASTTIAQWLTDSGINLNNLENTTYAASVGVKPVTTSETSTSTDNEVKTTDVDGNVTVNLDNYLNNAEGNLEVDSKTVGTLSSTFPNASTFTRNGLTIHLLGESSQYAPTTNGTSNITAKTYDELTEDEKAIVAALFKWWGSETLKLNEESYGISFTSDNAKVTDIGLYFYNDPSANTLAAVWNWARPSADGEAYQLMLNVNMNYYSGLSSNTDNSAVMNGKSNVTGAGYLDRTLAHEMTHAVMAANVNYFNNLPKFIKEGIAELTHGIDDERGNVIFKNAYDAEQLAGSLDMTNTGTGSQEVGDAYAGGYMFLRYFAYQSALQTLAMPAYGEITVDVDLSKLSNLAEGNVLYVDTTTTNPTVKVATDMNAYNATDAENNYNLLNLGSIGADNSGDLYYYVASDWIKQNITTSADIHDVYRVNANITVTGTGDYDGVQLYEGNTEINTGGGADFISASGQYATINTGADNDIVNINEGSHHNINLGEGDNQLLIKGNITVITTSEGAVSYLNSGSNYGNTITGGAGADTVTNGTSIWYLSAKNDDGTYGAYNVADDYIFYIDNSTPVQVTDGSYFDKSKKYYAATGFDEDSNINESIEVTPYNFYQYNYEYQMDLGDGDNVVKLATFEDSSLTTGAGNDIIAFTGSNETSNKISSGAGNDSVIFGSLNDNNALNYYSNLNKNYVDLGLGNDTITFGGSYNSIIGGRGNDQFTKYGTGDNNVYIYNSEFGADQISGFTSNDKICIADGYTAEASAVSSDKVTVTVKSGDTEKGTINITLASGATFDAGTNIYNSGTAFENIEYNVTATGRTITLTDDVSDVIYIDATKFTAPAEGTEYGTVTLSGTFGEDDQIIVYVGNKETNPADVKIKQDGTAALITFTHDSTSYAIKVVNAFKESITLGDTVSENHTLDGTYTKTGIASNATNAYILEYKTETKNLTLSGVSTAENISTDGATISVNTSSIYTEGDAKGTVTLATEADITLAVTGEDLGELSAGWTLNEQVATYSDVSKKGYIVDDKSIKYNADEHDKKLTISGIASTEDLTLEGTELTIKAANIGENKTIEIQENTGDYFVNLNNNISGVTFNISARTQIENNASNVTINGLNDVSDEDDENYIGYNDYINNNGGEVVINGRDGDDKIFNSGASVTIDGGAGNDSITNSGANVSINGGAGNDEIAISGENVTINVADGDDLIKIEDTNAVTVEEFGVGDVIEFKDNITSLTTVDGGVKINDVTIHGVTKSNVEENWEAVSGGFKYTSVTGTLTNEAENKLTYTSEDKTFTISGFAEGVTLAQIKAAVSVDGTTVTINNAEILDTSNTVEISEGYTLALGENITNKSEVKTAEFKQDETDKSKYTYTSAGDTAGYKVESSKIVYKANTVTTFEISGLADGVTLGNGITVDGKTIKISASALAEKDATLTTSDDYTLTLDGVSEPLTTAESWDGTDYKTGAVTTAGYTLSGNTITYTPAGTRTTLFSLSGVNSADGFTVSKNENAYTVEVADSVVTNLNAKTTITLDNVDENITATFDGTELSGKTEKTVDAAASLVNGKYTSASYFAYTNINGATLTYYPATTAKEFTITNLSNAAKLGENVIVTDGETTKFEFKAAALNKQNIEISGGTFEVVLNGDVDTEGETISEDKAISDGVLTYTAAGTGEFYKATASGVTYTGQVGSETLTISGLNTSATSTDGIEITKQNDGTFNIKFTDKDLLNKKAPTITTDETYTLEVATVIEPTVQNPAWKISGSAATLAAATSEGYKVSNNKIVYFAESPGASLFEISGLAANATLPELTTDAETITLDAAQLGNNAIIIDNAGNYSVQIEGDMTGKIFTGTSDVDKIKMAANSAVIKANSGDDEINITGANVTVIGGKGDDKITVNSSAVVTFDADSGNDTIYSYAAGTKLQLTASNYETKVSGSDVVIKIDDSTLTLENAKGTFQNSDITQLIDADNLPKGITMRKDTLTAAASFTGEIDLSKYPADVTKINAAAVTGNLTIKGNESANSIKSGKGNDSIFGGAGNDKLYGENGDDTISGGDGNDTLYGGDGKNIFVYTDGNDYIADYTAGSDSIQMDFTNVKSQVSGSNVILTIGEDEVTIKGAKDKEITFVDSNGKNSDTKIFFAETYYAPLEDGLKYDSKRVSLTAGSNFGGDEINLSNYLDTVAKVNASAVTKAFKITGKENQSYSILGGKGNDVITLGNGKNSVRGGNGADNITGGTGNDILKGEVGNDTLSGGTGNDTLTGGDGADVFIYGGGNDLITDYAAEDKINATFTKSKVSGSNVILTAEDGGTLTIKGAKNKTVTFVDDAGETKVQWIFYNETYYAPLADGLTYNNSKTQLTASSIFGGEINLPETYLKTVTKVNASAVKTALTITGNTNNNSISGGAGNDIISGGDSGKNTIRGGAGADSIKVSGENANKLYGDAGNDTIIGGTGNDTMYGGDGNDSIDGGNGNNKLYGNAGNDTILGGTGKDTLYGGAGADSINGGDGDDKLLGEAGDDTLIGGAGNDTFTGGAGTDVFVYEGGKDLITDYTAGEEIQLSGSYKVTEENYSYSGKNLTFTFDNDNTLTIKNAKNKTITINGDSKVYEVQKVNAQTYDLLYDNNFATDEFGIDDITEAKFEVTNIETQNNTEIEQDDKTLITYTDK